MTAKKESALAVLDEYRELVWREVQRYLVDPDYPVAFRVPGKRKKEQEFHWRLVKEYPLRKGKYLRPTLLVLSAEAMGAKREEAVRVAAAMQISEEWLLIHDDFEDGSIRRRGLPALHRLYGAELAVNGGDVLHVVMWKVIADTEKVLGWEKTRALMNEFYVMLMRTALGQTVEIEWTKGKEQSLTDEDWFFIADGKTSYYTIAGPMRLGAIVAGADKEQLEKLANFGKNLGRCFQLVDDVLDVTSDFAGLKEQGNDVYEGKRTVLVSHLWRRMKGSERRRLGKILSQPREAKTKEEVDWVIKKMESCGSVRYAKALAEKFKMKAEKEFKEELGFLSRSPAREKLGCLVDFILTRDR